VQGEHAPASRAPSVFVSSLRPCRATREPPVAAPSVATSRATDGAIRPGPPEGGEGALALCDWVSNSPGSPCATRGESERPPRYGRAVGTRRLVRDTYRQIVDTVEQCCGSPGTRTSGDECAVDRALLAGRGAMALPSILPSRREVRVVAPAASNSRSSAKLRTNRSHVAVDGLVSLARRGELHRSAINGTDPRTISRIEAWSARNGTCRSAPLPISTLPQSPVAPDPRRAPG
jgi:hypothetical protein